MEKQMISKTARRLVLSIAILIALSVSLVITTFAMVFSIVSVEDNIFGTGTVQINLNDDKPVIQEGEFVLEPGMTIKKDFFVKNESSCDVYYKLYFQNVSGGLADVLEIKICDGDTVLAEGNPSELTKANVEAIKEALRINEQKNLQIYFHFPNDAGNATQNLSLSFDLTVDAVQAKNNLNREFE